MKLKLGCRYSLILEIFFFFTTIIGLTYIIFINLTPIDYSKEARNTQRTTDIRQILDSLYLYIIDNNISIASIENIKSCSEGFSEIGKGSNKVDLDIMLVDYYIIDIPFDPSTGSFLATRYGVCYLPNSRIKITAFDAELNKDITLIR